MLLCTSTLLQFRGKWCTLTPLHLFITLLYRSGLMMKYNQVLNQTLVPPGVNSQATLQYTKSFKLAAPLPAVRTLS